MAARALAWVVAGATLLAGCLTSGQDVDPQSLRLPGLGDLGDPLMLDHDHADLALHKAATSNVKVLSHLAWDAILLDRFPAAQYGEIDVKGDLAFVAALLSGFAIVDIADPAAPKTLSFTPTTPVYVADIKAVGEGDTVLLGTQASIRRLTGLTGLPVPPTPSEIPSPVTRALPLTAIGLQAWDATDKANPVLAGYVYVDGGCHMVSVFEYSSGTHVFCAPNDNSVRIFKLNKVGPLVAFEPVAVWSPGDLSQVLDYKVNPLRAQFTHDMTVQADPLTGEPVMFVSFWDLGVHVVDVKDPAAAELLGTWAGEDALLWGGHTHTSMAAMVGGKRVVVNIPEYADIPAVFVLDATDYGAMRLLGEWTAHSDGDYGDNPNLFSTHNFQIVDEQVYMGMYHGGVWVLDISDPGRIQPRAYYLPDQGDAASTAVGTGAVPDTWDVVVANGHVFAVDIPTGFYALHIDGDPASADYDSFA